MRTFRIFSHPLIAAALLLPGLSACGVRQEVVRTSPNVRQAKTLTRPELIDWFRRLGQAPRSLLIKSVSLSFSAESAQSQRREKLPTANGVLIVTREGDLRLQIQAPVIQTTMADIVAHGRSFEFWYPHRKTLYKGTMDDELGVISLPEEIGDKAPRYNLAKLRPWHITQTFFHAPLAPDSTLLIIQEDTAAERYYLLHEMGRSSAGDPCLLQRIWLERANLQVRRKVLYDGTGAPICEISYQNYARFGSSDFPTVILLRRPQEGYQVQFEIKKAEIDAPLQDAMFQLTVPPGIEVKDIHAQ